MIRKKSKGWTFICSLLPGAGEMYMGGAGNADL